MATKQDILVYIREKGPTNVHKLALLLGEAKVVNDNTLMSEQFTELFWKMLTEKEITVTDDWQVSLVTNPNEKTVNKILKSLI